LGREVVYPPEPQLFNPIFFHSMQNVFTSAAISRPFFLALGLGCLLAAPLTSAFAQGEKKQPAKATTSKMADSKMSDGKMNDDKMTDSKMADSKMSTDKMADGKMTDSKMSADKMTDGKMAAKTTKPAVKKAPQAKATPDKMNH
jgi:hypothetical protein